MACVTTPEGSVVCNDGVVAGVELVHQDPVPRDRRPAEPHNAPYVRLVDQARMTPRRRRRVRAPKALPRAPKERLARRYLRDALTEVMARAGLKGNTAVWDLAARIAEAILEEYAKCTAWMCRRIAAYAVAKAAERLVGASTREILGIYGMDGGEAMSMDHKYDHILSRILGPRMQTSDPVIEELREAGVGCPSLYAKIREKMAAALQALGLIRFYPMVEEYARCTLKEYKVDLCGKKVANMAAALLWKAVKCLGLSASKNDVLKAVGFNGASLAVNRRARAIGGLSSCNTRCAGRAGGSSTA